MGLFYENHGSGTELAIWKAEEPVEALCSLLGLSPESLPSRAPSRRVEWLSARLLVKNMLKAEGVPVIEYDGYGKPLLPGTGLHLSISHTNQYVGVMLCKSECGIDMEMIHPRIEKLAERFLSGDEKEFISPTDRICSLYVVWGAKEVLYKVHGKKDIIFKDDLKVMPFAYAGEGHVTASLVKRGHEMTVKVKYKRLGDVMLTYAVG